MGILNNLQIRCEELERICLCGRQFTSPQRLPLTTAAKLPVNGVEVTAITPSGCQIVPCKCGLPDWHSLQAGAVVSW